MAHYDFAILGGGIFGIFAAIHLSKGKTSVLLIEREKELFQKASLVNQARLHGGYHYPRSIPTAKTAHENKQRFYKDHSAMINKRFKQYYGIARDGSLTDASQFESFCAFLHLPLSRIDPPAFVKSSMFEALYLTEEYSFDPGLLAKYYAGCLQDFPGIKVIKGAEIKGVDRGSDYWQVSIQQGENPAKTECANSVINATYSSLNVVNQLFGLAKIPMIHEIAEVALLESKIKDVGLTVIDGDFASFMPYGLSQLVSLSSVRYTSQSSCEGYFPVFPCQKRNQNCNNEHIPLCNTCAAKPYSNGRKMIAQIKKYLNDEIELIYRNSHYTVKSKLKTSYIDDSRPTMIRKLHSNPDFHCIFGGKMSSIYDVETYFNV